MKYKTTQKYIDNNYSPAKYRTGFDQITFHTAVSGARSLYTHFNNPKTGASSHFYVYKDGSVEQYVRHEDVAWTNSNGLANARSITFETWDAGRPNDTIRTEELYESCIEQAAKWCEMYNIPLVLLSKEQALSGERGFTLHKYFARKSCPAGLDVQRIIDGAKSKLEQDDEMTQKEKVDNKYNSLIIAQREDVWKQWQDGRLSDLGKWWVDHGDAELRSILKDIGRGDVLSSKKTPQELKEWYVAYPQGEGYYNIWKGASRSILARLKGLFNISY